MGKLKVLILIIGGLCVLTVWLIIAHFRLNKSLKEVNIIKEQEFNRQLIKEKDFIKKDLDEKYRADLVSYQAMQKRLELQKKKIKELESVVKEAKVQQAKQREKEDSRKKKTRKKRKRKKKTKAAGER